MRGFVVALVVLAACGKGDVGGGKSRLDLVLRHGWIVDGSGNPKYRGDVGVRGDRIAATS